MEKIVIDSEKCTGCGLCAKDCVGLDIKIENGKAKADGESCIRCGHCEAVCPNNAVKVQGYETPVEEFTSQTRLDPAELLSAIKTRRTVRQFTDQSVSEEITNLIIEAGRLAPTGTNSQGTSYIILQNTKAECEAVAVKMFRKLLGAGQKIIPQLKSMKIDDNFFFKKAPLVILVLGNDTVSASLAAQNMAFMAEANGLGVLFSGLFTGCVRFSGKIKKILGIKKEKPVITLVIGYPAVKYKRTANRNKAAVKFL